MADPDEISILIADDHPLVRGALREAVMGLVAGFGFFIVAEASRQIGVSELTAPWVAAWVPTAVASLLSLTVLLHQEDG